MHSSYFVSHLSSSARLEPEGFQGRFEPVIASPVQKRHLTHRQLSLLGQLCLCVYQGYDGGVQLTQSVDRFDQHKSDYMT
jgi:hypothetical protein